MEPLRAITLRCTSPVTHKAIERVMEQIPFTFCANLGFRHCEYTKLDPKDQPWFVSSELRQGVYKGVDHSDLLPLDEEIIEGMRGCEALFMYMMIRLEYARNISYNARKQRYLKHLRFWNDFIERNNINVLISSILPHEMPDHIIYELCKLKGIPTIFSHATPIRDTSFLQEDIEESAIQIKHRLDALSAEGGDVTLSPLLEEYYKKQTQPEGKFTVIFPETPQSALTKFVRRILSAPDLLIRWIPTLFSSRDWARRCCKMHEMWLQNRLRNFYDRHAVEPDFEKRFIYFPLQFQPECSTCPMAGAFVDQNISIHLLSSCIPSDVLIYIKEHPRQRKEGILGRNIAFYKELLTMPNVRLMKHESSTFALREHCSAVATGTGTAGLEALFREKPVLLFGHTFFQYAPSVFQIRTVDDCRAAIEAIFTKGEKPQLPAVRRFLKAVEDTRMYASISEWHLDNYTDRSIEESTKVFADALIEKLKQL